MVVGRTVVAAIQPGRTRVRRMEAPTAVVAAIQLRRHTTTAARAEVITEARDRMSVRDRMGVRVAIARDRTEAGIAK